MIIIMIMIKNVPIRFCGLLPSRTTSIPAPPAPEPRARPSTAAGATAALLRPIVRLYTHAALQVVMKTLKGRAYWSNGRSPATPSCSIRRTVFSSFPEKHLPPSDPRVYSLTITRSLRHLFPCPVDVSRRSFYPFTTMGTSPSRSKRNQDYSRPIASSPTRYARRSFIFV